MAGLGFLEHQLRLNVASFSGGWRMRLNLARTLMSRSDLLLLDEPTNHLDLDAILWLEDWLKAYEGTLILISHDRDFLDAITDHILHIENQELTLYTGNYSTFETTRSERLAQQQQAFENSKKPVLIYKSSLIALRLKPLKLVRHKVVLSNLNACNNLHLLM